MKLTRLRLVGFKSFVETTEFLIEPGLTGIVGPNGCGKSNLVEALRWVMGEASHKAMRAADMDDVIFGGSANRPARNHGEVALVLDNSDRTAPAQFNDYDSLEVVRHITRGSGSSYRVNGREVRARDVQILFADASTGARSPALVHQGRIGEIIAAKPAQRRRVLEEAAGIAGLHARRHEAELRLSAAEQNLSRLQDVITQLAAQIEALKRQARQAGRYRVVSAALRQAEATLCYLRWTAATADARTAADNKDLSARGLAEATGIQAQAAKQQALAATALPPAREAEARAAAALARLNRAREALDLEERRADERRTELELRLVQLGEAVGREKRLAADSTVNVTRLAHEAEGLRADDAAAAASQAGVTERVSEAEASLASVEKRFSDLTAALADHSARRGVLEQAVHEQTERARRFERELQDVATGLAALEPDPGRSQILAGFMEAAATAQTEVSTAEAALAATEAGHSMARQAVDAAKTPVEVLERRLHRLETEARTLAKLLDVDAQKLWPPVIDLITVEPGYEAALGAALGDELDAPIDQAAPLRWSGAVIDPSDPELPPGVTALGTLIAAPLELGRRLKQIGLVDRDEGARLATELKPGQRLVSREGDLWRWDGFAAAAHAPTAAARRLAQRNRLAALETDINAVRIDVARRRESLVTAEQVLREAVAAEAEARTRRREAQARADSARERSVLAEREVGRIAEKRSALAEAKSRLLADHSEALARLQAASEARAALPATVQLEADLAQVRGEVLAARGTLTDLRGEAQALSRQRAMDTRRLEAIATESRDWQGRMQAADTQVFALEAQAEQAERELAAAKEAPACFAARRQALIDEIAAAARERQMRADALAEAENMLAEADRAARAALEGMALAREDAARAAERSEAATRRLEDIAHEIQELLEVQPEALGSVAKLAPDVGLPSAAEVEASIEKLRRDRDRLGPVNLRAEQELGEIEAQHTGLCSERDDLTEAIKRLRQAIQSLNHEARERLASSFEVVNRHFTALFTKLFGGGTAELQLIDHDDPLEAGLEILAKPPGKKPQTLSLLSGGEQALTALALIFAVFLTNPAPICVLDEVDAPLDDHNVDRFCDLLDEMTKLTDTRYVIITHNPITMARMNRLFGVTMAERGVSQLVSVSLETAEKLREAS